MLRVDEIALSEALTEEVLLRETLGEYENSFWTRRKKRQILHDLNRIFVLFPPIKEMYDVRFVIYSFIRLWQEEKVYKFNFERAWRMNIYTILIKYGEHYDTHIKKRQETFSSQ